MLFKSKNFAQHAKVGYDSVMGFYVFGLRVQWYGVIIASCIMLAFVLGSLLAKRQGYRDTVPYEVLLLVVPIAILGARLYYVIFQSVPLRDFFNLRDGGTAIYGAIIFGMLGAFIFARWRRVGFFTFMDIVFLVTILSQSIGRWANFTNILGGHYEGYGIEVSNHVPPFTSMVRGVPHLSFWFLESILNLIGFGILLWFFLKKQTKWGQTSALYMIWYGSVRAILEAFRGDALFIGGTDLIFNRASFVVSILLITAGCVILYLSKKGYISQQNANLMAKVSDTEEVKSKDEHQL